MPANERERVSRKETMVRYYIATKLENHAAHNELRDWLADRGHQITYDWTTHGPVWRDGNERIAEVAGFEARGVVTADLVVVLLPGGRGTHAELGIAIGAGVPVLLVPSERGQIEGEGVCAFYRHPMVTIAAHQDLARLALEIATIAPAKPVWLSDAEYARQLGVPVETYRDRRRRAGEARRE